MKNLATSTSVIHQSVLTVLESLYSAVVSDVLDTLGLRQQALSNHVRPLSETRQVCGRVFPVRALPVTEIPAEPYKLQIAAVDALSAGDVLVADGADTRTCAFWGELLTTACVHKGVRGVVMTACTRDMWRINDLGFPVFGIGYHPGDDKGRLDVVEIGQPITIAGVKTKAGDFLLGDEDGVVVIPSEVAGEVIQRAQEKSSGENRVRDALAAGMSVGEAFKKYGIL